MNRIRFANRPVPPDDPFRYNPYMTSRKFISYFLLIVLLALVACQGNNAEDDPPTAADNATATTTPLQSVATVEATEVPTESNSEAAATIEPTVPQSLVDIATPQGDTTTTTNYSYRIINSYDHDPLAFTQGLVYLEGMLYEGTGLNGRSSLRRVNLESGEILQVIELAEQYFGEGIVVWDDRIIQLTWQSQQGFIYDRETFALIATFNYGTEGWGITHDGTQLIMSDGSSTLYFWDPVTLAETGRITVQDATGPIVRLNELEYINGEIWANVWQTNRIARINPQTGWVVGWIDFSGILDGVSYTPPIDVLNGIAHDPATGRIWITGKLWPKLFEIELISE